MILLIFAADTQKCNKGSIKKASRFFLDFSFYSETNLEHQMIFAFGVQVCIPGKSAGVRRKMHSHGCKVIYWAKVLPEQ